MSHLYEAAARQVAKLFRRATPGLEFFEAAKSARKLCLVKRFVTKHVFLRKDGTLGVVIRIRKGVDDETLDNRAALGVASDVITANKRWNDKYSVYQFARITRTPVHSAQPSSDPFIAQAKREQHAYLTEADSLRSVESFLVVFFEGKKAAAILPPKVLASQLKRSARLLTAKAKAYCKDLRGVTAPELLSQQDAFRVLYPLMNLKETHFEIPEDSDRVDYSLANSQIRWEKDRLRIGRTDAYFFSMKEEPNGTSPNMFRKLFSLEADVILWQRWQRKDNKTVRKAADEHRQHLNAFKRNNTVTTVMEHGKPGGSDPLLENEGAIESMKSLGKVSVALENKGLYFGRFAMGGVLYNCTPEQYAASMAEMEQVFTTHDAEVAEEVDGALASFRAMNFSSFWNLREVWMQNDHLADIGVATYAPYTGEWWDRHLRQPALATFAARNGYPFSLTAFTGQVMGHLIIGTVRSGKTFLVNWLLLLAGQYRPFRFVFDIGESYNFTTKMCGGEVAYVNSTNGARINPFADEMDLEFHFEWLRNCFTLSGHVPSVDEDTEIRNAIAEIYRQEPKNRRLSKLMLSGKLKDILDERWSIFDNETDDLRIADWQTFNFQFGKDEAALKEQFLTLILNRTNNIIRNPANRDRLKILVFEELFMQIKNKKLADMVLATLKDGPKWFCGTFLVTQSPEDLGEHTAFIRQTCPVVHFLPNPKFDRKLCAEWFSLGKAAVDAIASLVDREFLVNTKHFSKVLRFELPMESQFYWWFTTNPKEVALRDQLVARHGRKRALEMLINDYEALLDAEDRREQQQAVPEKKAMRRSA